MNTWILIAGVIGLFLLGAYTFLIVFSRKLLQLEKHIIKIFRSRTDTIPGIYEISKKHLTKHEDIFREAMKLRKEEFGILENSPSISSLIHTESLIHHEVNFIFKVCNKHPKLLKNGNFIYMREILIEKSISLGEMISLYKNMIERFNWFVKIKNYSIIGLFLPIKIKTQI